jgi:hypothetical protein
MSVGSGTLARYRRLAPVLLQVLQLHGKLRPVRITSGLVLVDYSGFDAIFVNTSAFLVTYPVRLPTTGLLDRNKFR